MIYPTPGNEQYYTARYWRVENSTQSRTYTIITKGNNVSAINNGYWGVRGTFQDGIYAGITYVPTLTSTYDSVSDTTTTTFTDSPNACYFWFGNLSTAVQPDQLDAIDPQLYAPFEGWNFGMLHSYGDITETTTTDISNTRDGRNYCINSLKKLYRLSSYTNLPTSFWNITPGDTIAFKYINNTVRTVLTYTNSSMTPETNKYIWYISANCAVGDTIQPFPADFHTEVINGSTYNVFTVPTGITKLCITYQYGNGSFDPSGTNIVSTVLKKTSTTTKGWIDITNDNPGGSYP